MAGKPGDVDEELTLSDVPAEGSPEEILSDPSIGIRSMSRRALVLEAESPKHLVNHHPHNPFCEICKNAHLKHMRMAHTGERSDDGLPPIKQRLQVLACDVVVVAKSHVDVSRRAADGSTGALAVRDAYSGLSLTFPLSRTTQEKVEECLKWFVGVGWTKKPQLLVKTDCADNLKTVSYTHLTLPTKA